jgi:ATP-dependent DNA ligase
MDLRTQTRRRTGDRHPYRRCRDAAVAHRPDGHGFGALLVGFYNGDRLRYAGKVGTGYDDRTLTALRTTLDGLAARSSPFAGTVNEHGSHWVRPELVAQIGFTEWTRDGRLRHPRFVGLRRDKPPHTVVRELPTGTRP